MSLTAVLVRRQLPVGKDVIRMNLLNWEVAFLTTSYSPRLFPNTCCPTKQMNSITVMHVRICLYLFVNGITNKMLQIDYDKVVITGAFLLVAKVQGYRKVTRQVLWPSSADRIDKERSNWCHLGVATHEYIWGFQGHWRNWHSDV